MSLYDAEMVRWCEEPIMKMSMAAEELDLRSH